MLLLGISEKALPAAPGAPTSLVATGGAGQESLTWTAASGAATYKVERSPSGTGTWAQIAAGIAGTAYTDSDAALTPGTAYDYRARGTNATGDGPYSNTATGTTTGQGIFIQTGGPDFWVLETGNYVVTGN